MQVKLKYNFFIGLAIFTTRDVSQPIRNAIVLNLIPLKTGTIAFLTESQGSLKKKVKGAC